MACKRPGVQIPSAPLQVTGHVRPLSARIAHVQQQTSSLHDRYDAVIISGEVGACKPDPATSLLAAEKPGVCGLVDDVAVNLPPAAELGMATIHHTDSATTVRELEQVEAAAGGGHGPAGGA
jgi:FMN phosphatase YigB (HAD superfamily)